MHFLKKHKKGFIIIMSVLCLITAFITAAYQIQPTVVEKSLGYVITPVQGFFTDIGNWFESRISYFVRMNDLESENRELKEKIESLTIENQLLKNVDAENAKLSELLNIDRKYAGYSKIGAEIISKDPGNWYNTFNIDKGAQDGIEKDMVVLGVGGLAGRVREAGYNYAVVVTLIDDSNAVSAKCLRTGDTGFVRGDATLMENGLCKMEFMSMEPDILVGDEIVTSHLSTIYPPGITIGYVTEVGPGPLGTKYALIKPAVDFRYMETVMIINELFQYQKLDEDPAQPEEKD